MNLNHCFLLAPDSRFRLTKLAFNQIRVWRSSVFIPCLALLLPGGRARALDATWEYAVQASASVRISPPQITLRWPQDSIGTPGSYTVYRKAPDANSWGAGTTLPGTTTSFLDTNVIVGATYEYQIVKIASTYSGYGYICAGINAPLVEDRGKLVLIVDNTCAADLDAELKGLEQDLTGDGWQVLRHDVPRDEKPTNVKSLIKADYDADSAHVKALLLFGHVPVVRSGSLNVDGHGSRSMPADVFYGDMDGTWTDSDGNGIYDQNTIPSDVELEVGRVDFADMPGRLAWDSPPTFPGEVELLRRYLSKDHNFRHKRVVASRRALVGDRFGNFNGEAFAASGYRNFAPFFGAANVVPANTSDNAPLDQKWISLLGVSSYLWAYGCGGGSYRSMSGLGIHPGYNDVWSADLVDSGSEAVFMMMFGSWLVDWDSEDNIMRAALATPTYGLTCSWSGRPHHFYHHMGVGETIGYGIRLSENNSGLYQNQVDRFLRGVHIALMGDPTLRLHPVGPPSSLTAVKVPEGVGLSWAASADLVPGYHVYRAADPSGPFTRLTGSMLSDNRFVDSSPTTGTYTYMVRAVKLEDTPSGTYYNASQGVFATVDIVPSTALPTVTVTTTNPDATEQGPDAGVFVFTRTGSTASALTVRYSLSGAAVNGTDYQQVATAATIPAGSASTTVTVTAINDDEAEGDETVMLTVSPDAAYAVGLPGNATVIIHDNAPSPPAKATVTVVITNAEISEGQTNPAVFTFTRAGDTGTALTVFYELTGAATKWNDYRRHEGDMPISITIPSGATSADLAIYAVDDVKVEGPESFTLTIANSPDYLVGSPGSANVTIKDNDSPQILPSVTVTATDATASRAGPDPGTFTFTRSGNAGAPLTVNFALGGTAIKWNDYRWDGDMPESVTIPAGATSTSLTIYPVGEPGSASSRSVILTIIPATAYKVGAPNRAAVTIAAGAVKITSLIRNFDGGIQLSWSAEPGRAYRVARKNNLSDSDWTDLSGDIIAAAASASWVDVTTDVSRQRYYQVRVVH